MDHLLIFGPVTKHNSPLFFFSSSLREEKLLGKCLKCKLGISGFFFFFFFFFTALESYEAFQEYVGEIGSREAPQLLPRQ